MKGVSRIFLLVVLGAAVFGCSPDSQRYTVDTPDGHTVYTVARKGALLREENFKVILVHGFNDNREVARQITGFLNQSEPNTYFYFEQE